MGTKPKSFRSTSIKKAVERNSASQRYRRKTNMKKADRLFQLTNLIRTRQPITAEELAKELEVSVRSVYRYIDDISANGIPVFGTTGIGYQLHDNFELPPLNLTDKELDALMLGMKMVKSWTGDELSNSTGTLISKIEAVLPKQLREKFSSVAFSPDLQDKKKDRNTWDILHNAIKNLQPVTIHYKAIDGNITFRTVFPLGLFYWGGKWTLGSWCTLRQDFRDFRTDKIDQLEIGSDEFTWNDSINIDAYFTSINKTKLN